jgi:hypothetical protein
MDRVPENTLTTASRQSRPLGLRIGRIWIVRLATVALSVLVAIVLVEGLLWLPDLIRGEPPAGPAFEGSVYEFSSTLHHRLIPNGRYRHSAYEFAYLWTNNALGMRDREHPLRKPAGTFRILVLGDSFVQGHGVSLDQTMVSRLEASLQQPKRAQPVEILNAGVFGYSPLLEYLYLRQIVDAVEPDLVIVAFFLGNDVGEDHFYVQRAHVSPDGEAVSFDDHEWPWSLILEELYGGGGDAPSVGAATAAQSQPLSQRARDVLRRSRVLTVLKNRLLDPWTYPAQREREFALVREHRDDIRYDLALVNYPVLSRDQRMAYWSVSKAYLEKIAGLCRAHDARMLLLVIPPYERLIGETDFQEPYEVLDDLGRQLSIPVVQLLPDFLRESPDTLYYTYDRHWTPEGHRRAAEIVDRELRARQLLPN